MPDLALRLKPLFGGQASDVVLDGRERRDDRDVREVLMTALVW